MSASETSLAQPGQAAGEGPFGRRLRAEFAFAGDWRNLNHGSFGSIPNAVRARLRHYQDAAEARPDGFIRYDYPALLDGARAAAAELVGAPVESVVLVGNATEGVNTVLRNVAWAAGDAIVTFSTVYEAVAKAADFIADYFGVEHRQVPLAYPVDDADIERAFRAAVAAAEAAGRRVRVCVLDVVSSRPGVPFPWVALVAACRELGVASLVDGAQGVGMVPLDLAAADPDFFVSNCHKWLHVPRGCALLYVPLRNQHLLPTTLATSHGYRARSSPLPPGAKSDFVLNFEFVGTRDNSPYLCVADSIAWRRRVLGGETAVLAYLWRLNKQGSAHVARALGTHVLDNRQRTLTDCAMANVALPLCIAPEADAAADAPAANAPVAVPAADADAALQWMARTMVDDYKTFMALFVMGHRFWTRLSAQVYLDMDDYDFAARVLKELCERVANKEYQDAA